MDFMFDLRKEEFECLRSQIVTSKGRGGSRYKPMAFTEQGVAMLSSVLRSKKAVEVNIQIIRTFVKLRQMIGSNKKLAEKVEAMERKYDRKFYAVFEVIKKLMTVEEEPVREIGFDLSKGGKSSKKKNQ